jgi:hypothetical protein
VITVSRYELRDEIAKLGNLSAVICSDSASLLSVAHKESHPVADFAHRGISKQPAVLTAEL